MIGKTKPVTATSPCSPPAQTAADKTARSTDTASPAALGDDILRGADAIAAFLFGDPRLRRRVYHLTSDARGGMPHFKLGAIICARKSTLVRWIEAQEGRH